MHYCPYLLSRKSKDKRCVQTSVTEVPSISFQPTSQTTNLCYDLFSLYSMQTVVSAKFKRTFQDFSLNVIFVSKHTFLSLTNYRLYYMCSATQGKLIQLQNDVKFVELSSLLNQVFETFVNFASFYTIEITLGCILSKK